MFFIFCFCIKEKTSYEMRISDCSSDLCSSDLVGSTLPLDPQQQAKAGAADHQGTAAVTEERQGQALGGQQADVHADVDQELTDPQERTIGRGSCRERVGQ